MIYCMKSFFKAELCISHLNLVVLRQVLAGLDHLDRVSPVLVHHGPRPVDLEVQDSAR